MHLVREEIAFFLGKRLLGSNRIGSRDVLS